MRKAAGIKKGSGEPNTQQSWYGYSCATWKKLLRAKMADLNANDMDAAVNIIAGSARSAGIEVKGLIDYG